MVLIDAISISIIEFDSFVDIGTHSERFVIRTLFMLYILSDLKLSSQSKMELTSANFRAMIHYFQRGLSQQQNIDQITAFVHVAP